VVEQHLHANAHAHQRLAPRRLEHGLLQPRGLQLAHAVAHRALAGQHNAISAQHLVRPRGDDHAPVAARHVHHRLRH
jgi:hypothetical protein